MLGPDELTRTLAHICNGFNLPVCSIISTQRLVSSLTICVCFRWFFFTVKPQVYLCCAHRFHKLRRPGFQSFTSSGQQQRQSTKNAWHGARFCGSISRFIKSLRVLDLESTEMKAKRAQHTQNNQTYRRYSDDMPSWLLVVVHLSRCDAVALVVSFGHHHDLRLCLSLLLRLHIAIFFRWLHVLDFKCFASNSHSHPPLMCVPRSGFCWSGGDALLYFRVLYFIRHIYLIVAESQQWRDDNAIETICIV